MDLVSRYINTGRFGTFVNNFLEEEYNRRKEEAEKDQEWKLWVLYVNSYAEESFGDWKNRVLPKGSSGKASSGSDTELDDDGIQAIINSRFPQ